MVLFKKKNWHLAVFNCNNYYYFFFIGVALVGIVTDVLSAQITSPLHKGRIEGKT